LTFLILPLVLYVSLYTWNWKTGVLDRLMADTGMEFAGWVLVPGEWVRTRADDLWTRYVDLRDMRAENEALQARVDGLTAALADAREKEARVGRLERLLGFVPPPAWTAFGARVIGHRLGPGSILETILVDRGRRHGTHRDTPVTSVRGVVGRIVRTGPSFSQVLLLDDIRSRVPVLGQENRIPGIVYGQGAGELLRVRFVPLNDPMQEGEVLITSGWGGVFPKGLPVARVVRVRRSDLSLFQDVWAAPLVEAALLEEVLVLNRVSPDGNPSPELFPAGAMPDRDDLSAAGE
jgi:rod shape-determining protein MreC